MFRDRLRLLRERSGLSQSELAARLHITPMCVSHWETGQRRPNVDDLAAIAEALSLPSEAFLVADEGALVDQVIQYLNRFRQPELAATGNDGRLSGNAVALHDEDIKLIPGTYGPEDPEALGHYQRLYAGALA